MKIITEEMRFRKRLCEFALKYGVTKAAKRYHTNRHFVYRQLEKYDGTLRSLALQSRKPHSHPNAHTKEELTLIKQIYSRYGCDGLAEVYVQLRKLSLYSSTIWFGLLKSNTFLAILLYLALYLLSFFFKSSSDVNSFLL